MRPLINIIPNFGEFKLQLEDDTVIGVRSYPIYSLEKDFFSEKEEKKLEGYKFQIVKMRVSKKDYKSYMDRYNTIVENLTDLGVTTGTLWTKVPEMKEGKILHSELVPIGTEEFQALDEIHRMDLCNSLNAVIHKGDNGKYITKTLIGSVYLEPKSRKLYTSGEDLGKYIYEDRYINHILNCTEAIEEWLDSANSLDMSKLFTQNSLVNSFESFEYEL